MPPPDPATALAETGRRPAPHSEVVADGGEQANDAIRDSAKKMSMSSGLQHMRQESPRETIRRAELHGLPQTFNHRRTSLRHGSYRPGRPDNICLAGRVSYEALRCEQPVRLFCQEPFYDLSRADLSGIDPSPLTWLGPPVGARNTLVSEDGHRTTPCGLRRNRTGFRSLQQDRADKGQAL
jgi:hypothetical protein